MKKNITINLFGSLYNIDEDAYELLQTYENQLRTYFSRQEGGDEISEDIERRVAELFEELKEQGKEAIDMDDVQSIIRRIGKPEDFQVSDEENETPKEENKKAEEKARGPKKLFRDPNDKMLGGVMSGLSHYFGGDSLLWRLIILILIIFSSGIFIVAYIVGWIVIPQAQTAEDFLRMEGKPVNPDTISQKVADDAKAANTPISEPHSGVNNLLKFIVMVFKVFFYVFVGLLVLAFALAAIGIFIAAIVALFSSLTLGQPWMIFSDRTNSMLNESVSIIPAGTSIYFWVLIVASILLFAIPAFGAIHHMLRTAHKVEPMSTSGKTFTLVTWVVSLAAVIFCGCSFASSMDKIEETYNAKHPAASYNYTIQDRHWRDLINEMDDADDVENVKAFLDDSLKIHWSRNESTDNFIEENSASDLQPGVYRLVVSAYASQSGANIFAKVGDRVYTKEISWGTVDKLPQNTVKDEDGDEVHYVTSIPEVQIDSIIVPESSQVTYGLTTKENITKSNWKGRFLLYSGNYRMERMNPLKHDTKKK